MKTWIIVIAAMTLIALVGIVTAQMLENEDSTITSGQDCSSGSNCPYAGSEGCTANNNCGLAGCGAVKGVSNCGCGRG